MRYKIPLKDQIQIDVTLQTNTNPVKTKKGTLHALWSVQQCHQQYCPNTKNWNKLLADSVHGSWCNGTLLTWSALLWDKNIIWVLLHGSLWQINLGHDRRSDLYMWLWRRKLRASETSVRIILITVAKVPQKLVSSTFRIAQLEVELKTGLKDHGFSEPKRKEVELGSHSWMDCLAAELFLNSCFSDTVFVTLAHTAVETAISRVHKLLHTSVVPTSLTLLFWQWLMVSSGLWVRVHRWAIHRYLTPPPFPIPAVSVDVKHHNYLFHWFWFVASHDLRSCVHWFVKEASLVALLKFVEQEGQRPLETPAPDQVQFPFTLLQVSFYPISYSFYSLHHSLPCYKSVSTLSLTLSLSPSLPPSLSCLTRVNKGALLFLCFFFSSMTSWFCVQHPVSVVNWCSLMISSFVWQGITGQLLSRTLNMESLILRLSEVTEYDDVRFFVMKAMKQELGKTPIQVQTGLDRFVCGLSLSFSAVDGVLALVCLLLLFFFSVDLFLGGGRWCGWFGCMGLFLLFLGGGKEG